MSRGRFLLVLFAAVLLAAATVMAIRVDLGGIGTLIERAGNWPDAIYDPVLSITGATVMGTILLLCLWVALVPLWVWGLAERFRARERRRAWPVLAAAPGPIGLLMALGVALAVASMAETDENRAFLSVEEIMAEMDAAPWQAGLVHVTGLVGFGLFVLSILLLVALSVEALRPGRRPVPEDVF